MGKEQPAKPSPIVGILFLLIGLGLAIYGWYAWGWTAIDSSNWPSVGGLVVKSSVSGDIFTIIYDYKVNGKEYSARRIDYSNYRTSSLSAHNYSKKYPLGKEVTVYYDPSKPSRAVLIKGGANHNGKIAIVFGILFAIFPLCSLVKQLFCSESGEKLPTE